MDEVNPHRKNRREYNEHLNYFAGKITPTDFTPKAYWKWKSEEKRKVYIDERDRWASEKAQVLNDFTIPEILSMFIEKEKQKQLSLRSKLCAEIMSVNETLHQISAVSNMIMFSEDVESYDMSPDDIPENKENKPVLLLGKNFKASVLAKIKNKRRQ